MKDKLLERIKQHPRLVVAQDFEVVCQKWNIKKNQYENGRLGVESQEEAWWVQLRVIHRNQPGIATASVLSEGTVDRLVHDALMCAEQSHPDPWFRFPLWSGKSSPASGDRQGPPKGFWDSSHPAIQNPSLRFLEKYEWWEVETDIYRRSEKLSKSDWVGAAYQNWVLDKVQEGSWGACNRSERLLKLQAAAQLLTMAAEEPKPWEEPPVFSMSGRALAPILQHMGNWFSGARVREKRGPLQMEDLNTQVFSSALTLVDDFRAVQTPFGMAFDLDGIAAQKTQLVEGGMLKAFLYDAYSGGMENCRSTGNSLRLSNEQEPKLRFKTLSVEPGGQSPQQLWAKEGRGVWIEGWTTLEFLNDTKIQASGYGWLMDRGDKIKPICFSSARWELMQLWKNLHAVGSDPISFGWTVSPTLFFRGSL